MKKLIAPLAAVAVALSTLAPLVPADAAPRQPLTKTQCQRLRGVDPWVPNGSGTQHTYHAHNIQRIPRMV